VTLDYKAPNVPGRSYAARLVLMFLAVSSDHSNNRWNAHNECKEEAESGRFNERDLVGPNFQ
jgi:hypothetical protein